VLLTKDNLAKRNWQGSKNVFIAIRMKQHNIFLLSTLLQRWFGELFIWLSACGSELERERTNRVGICAVLWALWNVRNDYIFLTELNKIPLCRL
jgi:hypothetical protein